MLIPLSPAARPPARMLAHLPPSPACLQNILLDTRTADAVHIDLGIAFEQVGAGGVVRVKS